MRENYREALQSVSDMIHPFTIQDNKMQTLSEVEKRLTEKAQKIEEGMAA